MYGAEELDIKGLLAVGDLVYDTDDEQDNALLRLSRKISGQYVEVFESFADAAFHGQVARPVSDQALAAASALRRLAAAASDAALLAILDGLNPLLGLSAARGARERSQLLAGMRQWVLDFADLVDPVQASRMRGLVRFDRKDHPMLRALAKLHGVGPARLQRLYSAGLFSVEALVGADPLEVAQVTGMPFTLAERVVAYAGTFAKEERDRCAEDLTRRTADVGQTLASLRRAGVDPAELVAATRAALKQLEAALSDNQPDHQEHR